MAERRTENDDNVVVLSWNDRPVTRYHDEVWSAWLHGTVALLHEGERSLLVVPMATTPAAVALARRLYRLGAVADLDRAS